MLKKASYPHMEASALLTNNRKAKEITREDLITGGCALVSCFIREPEFVGQTKDRLATNEAQRLVENSVRDHFDNWLAADTKSAGAILDFLCKHECSSGSNFTWLHRF